MIHAPMAGERPCGIFLVQPSEQSAFECLAQRHLGSRNVALLRTTPDKAPASESWLLNDAASTCLKELRFFNIHEPHVALSGPLNGTGNENGHMVI